MYLYEHFQNLVPCPIFKIININKKRKNFSLLIKAQSGVEASDLNRLLGNTKTVINKENTKKEEFSCSRVSTLG